MPMNQMVRASMEREAVCAAKCGAYSLPEKVGTESAKSCGGAGKKNA